MVRAFGADFGRFWVVGSLDLLLLLRDTSPGNERPGKGPPANQEKQISRFRSVLGCTDRGGFNVVVQGDVTREGEGSTCKSRAQI